MEKSDFLNYRALVLEVRHLRALVSELERAALREKPRDDGVLELYRARVEEKNAALIAIETAIGSLDSPVERLLMRLRYIDGRSWPSISRELRPLGCKERRVYYLHGSALEKLKGF